MPSCLAVMLDWSALSACSKGLCVLLLWSMSSENAALALSSLHYFHCWPSSSCFEKNINIILLLTACGACLAALDHYWDDSVQFLESSFTSSKRLIRCSYVLSPTHSAPLRLIYGWCYLMLANGSFRQGACKPFDLDFNFLLSFCSTVPAIIVS